MRLQFSINLVIEGSVEIASVDFVNALDFAKRTVNSYFIDTLESCSTKEGGKKIDFSFETYRAVVFYQKALHALRKDALCTHLVFAPQ